MRTFKFFNGIDDEPQYLEPIELEMEDMILEEGFSESDPSWMWAEEMGIENYDGRELVSIECRGIREFLNQFPRHFIVPMVSITSGPHIHTHLTAGEGWGFDIQNDLATFIYVRI